MESAQVESCKLYRALERKEMSRMELTMSNLQQECNAQFVTNCKQFAARFLMFVLDHTH